MDRSRHQTVEVVPWSKWLRRLYFILVAISCPVSQGATTRCPETVDQDCVCDIRKGLNQRGGWEISCFNRNLDTQYGLEYAIRAFMKLECIHEAPYSQGMFQKYNIDEVGYFQFINCPLPVNLTLAEALNGQTVRKLKFEGDKQGVYFDSSTFEGLTALESLNLNKNQIESVPEDLFSNLTKLRSIDLNENSLKVLPENLFEGLNELVSIQLGSNKLESLPADIFVNLTQLQRLYLYKNKIKELPAGIFFGLKSLNALDMAHNQIQELHQELFFDTPQLKHLNIRGNNFTKLQSDLFQGTKRLEYLDFSDNRLTKIPENLLDGLNFLKNITFNNCNLKGIDEAFFSYAPNLTTISMFHNRLTSIPPGLFKKNQKLIEIRMQYNDILQLSTDVFDKNFNLISLRMTYNNLTSLPVGIFDQLSHLQILDLTGNALKSLSSSLLDQNQKLVELRLDKNQITELRGNLPFGQSNLLKIVDLSDNKITELPSSINWGVYLSLEKISLNNNNLTILRVPQIFAFVEDVELEVQNNQIRTVNVEEVKMHEAVQEKRTKTTMKVYLQGNPLDCDCRLFSFSSYARHNDFRKPKLVDFNDLEDLECQEPVELRGTKLAEVRQEDFLCPVTEGCPNNCDCNKKGVDKAIVVRCNGLHALPDILPLGNTEVHLENNSIANLDSLDSSIWQNVTKLYLDNNNITVGDWILPMHLRVLSLKGNLLRYLPQTFTDYVENNDHVEVFLGDNPWLCDCDTLNMKDWLYENVKKIPDINDMYCSDPVKQNGTEVITTVGRLTDEICPQNNLVNNSHLITVSIICVILAVLLLVVSVLYYRNKQTVIAYIYIHFYHVFVCVFNEDDLDEDKSFDAFVSYSSADRDLAMDLVSHLENGDPSFKLCIHERDWLPGNLISWNIVNSVQNSRKTILVLSKDFLDSVWFQVEFHTAYYQMLEDRIDRLIVIVRGELPEKSTLDKDLQFLLSTKTFLVWGERWFWEKLRYALPHRRGTSNTIATKSAMQGKSFPLRERPNPNLVKTVEDKIASLSRDDKAKRTDSPRNGEIRTESPRNSDIRTDSPRNSEVRNDSPRNGETRTGVSRNGDAQTNNSSANTIPANTIQINSTKAQSRRFNTRTNNSQNGPQKEKTRDVVAL